MLKRRSNFSIFVYNKRIHAMGGFDGRKHTKSIEYYEEELNIWVRMKVKLSRGTAGFSLVPRGNHELLISGGMTQQGPSQACHLVNLKEQSILGDKKLNEVRTLPQTVQVDGERFVVFGGMVKANKFEVFEEDEWRVLEEVGVQGVEEILDSGIRGFATAQQAVRVRDEVVVQQQMVHYMDPENTSFLVGNDEFPYLLPIERNGIIHQKVAVPHQLRLQSYMSSCHVDSVLPNCVQLFLCGGIDCRISTISKKAYLVTILFPELKVKAKPIGKLQYYRYAAACVFKYPYVYVLGGRGY